MTQRPVHLAVQGVGKAFGSTRALDDVSIDIVEGSVHAFVGENGAGKSTLGKIIAGVLPPDRGSLVLRGAPVTFSSPRQALDRGVAIVAQELTLVPKLTVASNVFLGFEPRRATFINRGELAARYRRLADETGFDLPPGARVEQLAIGQQQQVEILRALARDAQLIVFDEPTAALSAVEASRLHAVVRALAAGGRTVILVSHFLPEILELADTVTVLRDGAVVRTAPTSGETESSLIAAMLGRSLGRTFPVKAPPDPGAPVVLDVRGLSAPGVQEATMHLRAGEIVGLAGLIGAGRSELARAIFGAATPSEGGVQLGSHPLGRSPAESIRVGVALIPESRQEDGLLLGRPVRENVSLAGLRSMTRFGFVQRRGEEARVRDALHRVDVTASPDAAAATLSGGNQQKLLFARAVLGSPSLLIADEPTRGVDIGAKREIYEHIVELARSGAAILLISSEIEELLGLAHRVLVMRKGRIVAEIAGDALTEDAILNAAFGAAA